MSCHRRQQNSTAMDSLPESLLLEILSRLDDSADVARCRVASKGFNAVFPGLRSINLRCSQEWFSRASRSQRIKPFMSVFLDLISKLESVESICVGLSIIERDRSNVFYLTDDDFAKEWLPRVSRSLKSLSITDDLRKDSNRNFLALISESCHNLVNLNLGFLWLSVNNMNPMPMLTSLTLKSIVLKDGHLNELIKCLPNLQVLILLDVTCTWITHIKIHLLNLKTFVWHDYHDELPSFTIITPNLTTLRIDCSNACGFRIEAPLLSSLRLNVRSYGCELELKMIKVKTLWLRAFDVGFFLSRFPISRTVETLTLDSIEEPPREYRDSKFALGKVFTVFPNVSSLCIKPGACLELEACLDAEAWEILDGRTGLKTFCAYLMLVDPSFTFSFVACVLDQCVNLSNVSLLIHDNVARRVSESFRSKCMARWPGLKWRWGIWKKYRKDSWIADGSSFKHHKSYKKHLI